MGERFAGLVMGTATKPLCQARGPERCIGGGIALGKRRAASVRRKSRSRSMRKVSSKFRRAMEREFLRRHGEISDKVLTADEEDTRTASRPA